VDFLCVVFMSILWLSLLMTAVWLSLRVVSAGYVDKPGTSNIRKIGQDTRHKLDQASEDYLETVYERFRDFNIRLNKEQDNEREK
jgi:fructose-1,6-bisphosphatase